MRGVRGKNLIAVDYEAAEQILVCRFAKSGEYRYKGVPENVFQSLLRVPFADSYFTKVIKGKYPVIKPEKVSNGKVSNVQDAAGRVCDGSDAGRLFEERPDSRGLHAERQNLHRDDDGHAGSSQGVLPDRRPDAQSTGGRVVELFRAENGLTFEEEGHRYMLDGKRIISLTQILDAAGLVDYSGVQPDVLANKAKFGTKVHEYTKWIDQGELEPEDIKTLMDHPTYGPRITGWQQFCDDFNFCMDLNWCEILAACKVNGMLYAMTIDRFGTIGPATDQTPAVVEIKTCCDREFAHQIQTAGQAIPFRGDGSVPMKRYAVYLLDKANGSGRFYFAQQHEERNDEKLFLAALMLTQARINHKLLKG